MTYEEYFEEVSKLIPSYLVELNIKPVKWGYSYNQAKIKIIPVRVSYADNKISIYYHTLEIEGIGKVVFNENCYVKAELTKEEYSELLFLYITNNNGCDDVVLKDFFK